MMIKHGYNKGIFDETGLKIPIQFDLETHCNLLLTGCSGSGKSYALLFLMGSVLKSNKEIEIFSVILRTLSILNFCKIIRIIMPVMIAMLDL